jgi:protein phosphatase 2C family protein 2/3
LPHHKNKLKYSAWDKHSGTLFSKLTATSEPITDKHTTTGEDETVIFGASSMQGWRISMEDAHTTIVRMPNQAPPWPPLANTMQRKRGKSPIRELVDHNLDPTTEPFPDTINIPPDANIVSDEKLFNDNRHVSFFGVYDGHGGQTVARYTGQRLHWKVAETPEFGKHEYAAAMTKGFLAMDTELRDGLFRIGEWLTVLKIQTFLEILRGVRQSPH